MTPPAISPDDISIVSDVIFDAWLLTKTNERIEPFVERLMKQVIVELKERERKLRDDRRFAGKGD